MEGVWGTKGLKSPAWEISKLLQYSRWMLETILFQHELYQETLAWANLVLAQFSRKVFVSVLLKSMHVLQCLTKAAFRCLKCVVSLKIPALQVLVVSEDVVPTPQKICSFLLTAVFDLASVWVRVLTKNIGNRSKPKMWLKLHVKNFEQLVSLIQFMKEITTCFYHNPIELAICDCHV